MQQRVAIAQALMTNPRILLMDEAFSALDPGTRKEMQRLIRQLWRETGSTILFVTHNTHEALALGTPVVSTDVTGIPEVVRDGETGLQVPQRDPEALAEALDRLLTDADLRVHLAAGGRKLIEAEFDIDRNTERRRAMFRAAGRHRLVAQEVG